MISVKYFNIQLLCAFSILCAATTHAFPFTDTPIRFSSSTTTAESAPVRSDSRINEIGKDVIELNKKMNDLEKAHKDGFNKIATQLSRNRHKNKVIVVLSALTYIGFADPAAREALIAACERVKNAIFNSESEKTQK